MSEVGCVSGDFPIPLILPVEIQVRELDAKIFFACIAARRGHPVVIGRLKSVLARIASFPRSVFIAKGMGPGSVEKFAVIRGLGHEIAGWDEEALVHFPPETHFGKRVSPRAGRYLSHLFAWGPENAELWRSNPQFRDSKIHVTGNPRLDLLRREIRPYFDAEAQALREAHGDFVLINTNFPLVNSNRGLFRGPDSSGAGRTPGIGARGMTPGFAQNLYRHKRANFERFQSLIPELSRAFPEIRIVIRPHPSEKPEAYQRLAAEYTRVHVTNEGSVIPWSMASRAVIHNGCTTGVEANLLEVPTLSYGPSIDPEIDLGRAFVMPNLLSHPCPDFDSLHATLKGILAGELGCADSDERRQLLAEFFPPQAGPFASERIVDVLAGVMRAAPAAGRPSLARRAEAWRRIEAPRLGNALTKRLGLRVGGRSPAPRGARRSVYPEVSHTEMRERVDRFERILGRGGALRVDPLERHVYRIHI